jgi:hypothetical protein
MTTLVGHTNGTDPHDHETNYGTGTAVVIIVLGFLLIGMTVATPYFTSDTYYTPLGRRPQQVVLVRADTPIVQGTPVAGNATQSVTASPGGTLVGTVEMSATPDLSCLKSV